MRMIAAFVAGINRQIELMGRDLPPEFRKLGYTPEPFTVRDVVAIARGIWWSLNGRIDRIVAAEAARLLPEAFRGAVPDAGSLGASRAAARRRHRRCDRQQQLGGAWQPHRRRQAGAVRRSASAVLGAVELVRIRAARAGGRRGRRRPSRLPRHVVGQQRHASPGRSPTTWPRRATCMSSRSIRATRGAIATATPGATFDERQRRHQGARRGGARTDHPLHRARPDGQRAGAVARCRPAIRRCRCAGSAWSTWTTSAPPSR